jgi:MFS transporter, FHS family, L-fucose permease
MAENSKPSKALASPGYLLPFIILTALFFIFGFITNLNMGLVPELKKIFEIQGLATWQAMLANFAFFTAYFVFSTPASWLIEAIGYKRTMVVSLFIQVAGAAMFLPAAQLVSFPLFLAAIFVVGAGVATLQTAANPYVAILGPEESSAVRLTLAQAANSLGGTIAPWIAGTFILAGAVLIPAKVALESPAVQHADQVLIANTVRMPYAIIAVALAILGIAVAFMRLPHIDQPQSSHVSEAAVASRSVWSYRHTVLGALGIFVYVGVEVGLATTMVLYFSDTVHGGLNVLSVPEAQKLVLFYWLGALVGRLLGSWILTMIKAGKLLGIFGVTAAVLVLVSILSPGHVAVAALILVGFFNSIMFPNIFALGIAGLGPMTSRGSGLIMTAIVGGALIPVAIGWVVDHSNYQWALVIPICCYLYIAWYGLWGSKPQKTAVAA